MHLLGLRATHPYQTLITTADLEPLQPFEEAAATARAEFLALYGEEALFMHPRAESSRVQTPITTAEDTLRVCRYLIWPLKIGELQYAVLCYY